MKSCIKIRIPVIARLTEGMSSEDSRLEEPVDKTISYNDSANKRLCYRTKKRVYRTLVYVKPNKWKPSFSSWYFCTLKAYCYSFGNSYLWIIAFPSSINLQKSSKKKKKNRNVRGIRNNERFWFLLQVFRYVLYTKKERQFVGWTARKLKETQ